MNKNKCTEIAEFQVGFGVTDEDFFRIVESLELNFHVKQAGFIDTELVKDNEQSRWSMIQHWESIEQAKEASKIMMKEPVAENFIKALDPKSVKIRYLNHVNLWRK